jgi:hypothetical protein
MAAVKKAVSKVLHPKRELRERRRRRRENDDDPDGDSSDEEARSNDASSSSLASSSRASQDDSSRLTSAFNTSGLTDSDSDDEMFIDAQEPDGVIIEHAATIPDKGQDGIQEISEPANSTSIPRSTAAHLNGQDPALAVQLKPTDRHYLNKALVQSV